MKEVTEENGGSRFMSQRTPHSLSFDITGVPLEVALAVPFSDSALGHSLIRGWSFAVNGDLILHWHCDNLKSNPLPAPMDLKQTVSFVENWLKTADYGPEPDTDGSTGKSARVYCAQWNTNGYDSSAYIAVSPEWLIYGK